MKENAGNLPYCMRDLSFGRNLPLITFYHAVHQTLHHISLPHGGRGQGKFLQAEMGQVLHRASNTLSQMRGSVPLKDRGLSKLSERGGSQFCLGNNAL